MDKNAVKAAGVEYDRAAESLALLKAANDFPTVEKHWVAFLGSAGRVFTKLEQGSRCRAKASRGGARKCMNGEQTRSCATFGTRET
jgi:hypothetical protein